MTDPAVLAEVARLDAARLRGRARAIRARVRHLEMKTWRNDLGPGERAALLAAAAKAEEDARRLLRGK